MCRGVPAARRAKSPASGLPRLQRQSAGRVDVQPATFGFRNFGVGDPHTWGKVNPRIEQSLKPGHSNALKQLGHASMKCPCTIGSLDGRHGHMSHILRKLVRELVRGH